MRWFEALKWGIVEGLCQKKRVRYECGCEYWYEPKTIPDSICSVHNKPIHTENIVIPDISLSPDKALNDHEIIKKGDIFEFNLNHKVCRSEFTQVYDKMTVGQFKRCLYDEQDIQVYRLSMK